MTHLELFLCSSCLDVVKKGDDLEQSEDAERRHVLAGSEGLEADKRNLHTADQTNYVECAVCWK